MGCCLVVGDGVSFIDKLLTKSRQRDDDSDSAAREIQTHGPRFRRSVRPSVSLGSEKGGTGVG